MGGGMGGGMGDIFEMFGMGGMGGMGKKKSYGPQKGETSKYPLNATLEDLYNGAERIVRLTRSRNCGTCKGQGSTNTSETKTCSKCKGKGSIQMYRQIGPGFVQQVQAPCPDCNGEGKIVDEKYKCQVCKGKKIVQEEKVVSISIEKGMKEGQKLVLYGEGDEKPGIIPGDILFIIQQKPHKIFKRDGHNLIMKKKISLTEALTSVASKIETLDKRVLFCKTNPGNIVKPGDVLQIKNEGFPVHKDPFIKGNLYIEFEIEFPKKIPENISEKLEKILPPKEKIEITKDMDEVSLTEAVFEEETKRAKESYEDDEEEHGGQGVQCGTQ